MDGFLISFVAALYKKEAVCGALAGSIAAAVKVLVCAESNHEWCKAHFVFHHCGGGAQAKKVNNQDNLAATAVKSPLCPAAI
jgi:hypothetical protein